MNVKVLADLRHISKPLNEETFVETSHLEIFGGSFKYLKLCALFSPSVSLPHPLFLFVLFADVAVLI